MHFLLFALLLLGTVVTGVVFFLGQIMTWEEFRKGNCGWFLVGVVEAFLVGTLFYHLLSNLISLIEAGI